MRLALAAALLAFAPLPARALAQSSAPAAAPSEPAPSAPVTAAPATQTASNGLPASYGPPRTLRAYWHVFAAFAITWALVFGYVLSLGRRFGRLEREIDGRVAS